MCLKYSSKYSLYKSPCIFCCLRTCYQASPFVFHRRKNIMQGWSNTGVFWVNSSSPCMCKAWCQSSPTREICLDSRTRLMTGTTEICMFTKLISELKEAKHSLLLVVTSALRVFQCVVQTSWDTRHNETASVLHKSHIWPSRRHQPYI